MKPRLSLIVAMSENRVIGRENVLPWHIKSDLKQFKTITHSKPILMGSNTWDSLPRKPLPGRLNLVLSRDILFEAKGGVICTTLFEALEIAREHAADEAVDEICIIGGANVYEQTIAKADRLYVTEVHVWLEGDAQFPEIDPEQWALTSSEFHHAGDGDDYDFTTKVFERTKG